MCACDTSAAEHNGWAFLHNASLHTWNYCKRASNFFHHTLFACCMSAVFIYYFLKLTLGWICKYNIYARKKPMRGWNVNIKIDCVLKGLSAAREQRAQSICGERSKNYTPNSLLWKTNACFNVGRKKFALTCVVAVDDDEEVVDQKARLMQINCNKKNTAFSKK